MMNNETIAKAMRLLEVHANKEIESPGIYCPADFDGNSDDIWEAGVDAGMDYERSAFAKYVLDVMLGREA